MDQPAAITSFGSWFLAHSADLRNLAIALLALSAVPFFAWRASVLRRLSQSALARAERAARAARLDELNAAYRNLGHDKAPLRAAAVFALERLAREMPDDQGAIIESLVAFVRQRVPAPAGIPTARGFMRPPPAREILLPVQPDVQAAVAAIGRRNVAQDPATLRLGFAGVNLSNYDFAGGNFVGADFRDSYLIGANFVGATIDDAVFARAHIETADFYGASCRQARLGASCASGTRFTGAELEGAEFVDADLRDAEMMRARVARADFRGADLSGVRFDEAVGLPAARFTPAATLAPVPTVAFARERAPRRASGAAN